MKLKTALIAWGLALAAGSASAQTTINISGSSAFRAVAHRAILSSLDTPIFAYSGTERPEWRIAGNFLW